MTFDPQKHHRRSNRLQGYDYADEGAYFVTPCVEGRQCLFGEVANGQCVLSDVGNTIAHHWAILPQKYPHVELDEFIIMPNHMHGVLLVSAVGAGSPRPTLGQIMGFFKYQTTVEVNSRRASSGAKLWQRNYYDHIIRNDRSLNAIREYVHTNAQRWSDDRENPSGTGRDDVQRWVETLSELTGPPTRQGGETPPLRGEKMGQYPTPGGETPPRQGDQMGPHPTQGEDAIDLFIRDTADWGNNG